MPTTYTHDLFGKAVYQRLPEEMKEIIMHCRMAYLIGLHGPDILFYYRPFLKNEINQTGHKMHDEIAADFFLSCKEKYRETGDQTLLVYILGFICHYMLDSTCHPYIYRYMEKTGAKHDEIETELDRALMEKYGHNPFSFHPASGLHPEKDEVRAAAAALEGISEKKLRKCLRGMRFYTGVTVCRNPLKRKLLLRLLRIFKVYDETQGRILRKKPVSRCQESTGELVSMVKCAVPETVTVLEEFYNTLGEEGHINYRFQRNYK